MATNKENTRNALFVGLAFAAGFLCYHFIFGRARPVEGAEQFKAEIAAKDSAIYIYRDSLSLSAARVAELEARDTGLQKVIDLQAARLRLINNKLYETKGKIDLFTPSDIRAYLQREGLPVISP